MDEYNRILIEEYCRKSKTKKAKFLRRLLAASYGYDVDLSEADALELSKLIDRERSREMKEALEDLDRCLFDV